MVSTLDIRLHGSSLNIVKQCWPGLSDILESKFGCVATIEGVSFERNMNFGQRKRQTVAKEKRFSVRLPAGVEVSVWKADLIDFQVDAVVNAANCGLQHGSGLAQALCEAGGPQIQKESDNHISAYGSLNTGQAVVTTAGSLPCKMIIHAVGPHRKHNFTKSDVSDAKPLLEKAIKSILDRVEENHLDTVAIPAISSRLFNYPLQECAETIVSAVKEYCERFSTRAHLPKEIFFVNHDDVTVTEMVRACQRILALHQPHQSMSYSKAARSDTRGATKTSELSIQIGGVSLTLKSDKIEDQVVDVIVNTTSEGKDLKAGQISCALLNKAGHRMQDEIRRAPEGKHIIITKGYGLRCTEVFHTFCIAKGERASHKVLSSSVLECLETAAKKGHESIAFPAIGTGNLKFSKQEAADLMSAAVVKFAKEFTGKLDVYFVIFPSDSGTFQAFEDKMKSLRQDAPQSSFTPALKEDYSFRKTPKIPCIILSAPSKESVSEAGKWLTRLITKPSAHVVICNNFIQHFGEMEYMQLYHQTKNNVKIEEFLTDGHACLTVDADSAEDAVVAALQVEAMLCTVQKNFVTEENEMFSLLAGQVPRGRERQTKTLDHSSSEFKSRIRTFSDQGLGILKVDKVENPSLEMLFELKKKQLGCFSSEKMFQRITAQFCEMIGQIGFHAECAPPEKAEYGEGIYFARTVKKAMEVWREKKDEYLYFVEADVLTGNSTRGQPGLTLPPAAGDPSIRFDSVTGGSDISVIFNGYQALPRYIITCEKISYTTL